MESILLKIPTKASTANDWVVWHRGLKSRFGKKNANLLFLSAFEKRGNIGIVNENMQNYFESQGITLDQTTLNNLKGIISDTTDFFSDFAKAGMVTTFVVGGILILSVGMLAINIARTAKASDLTKLAGR